MYHTSIFEPILFASVFLSLEIITWIIFSITTLCITLKLGTRVLFSPAKDGGIYIVDLALSVQASQTCRGYISETITDLNMKRQGCIYLIEYKCTAQEPKPSTSFFRAITLCSFFPYIIQCPGVANSETITDLNMKHQGCIDFIEDKCTAQE